MLLKHLWLTVILAPWVATRTADFIAPSNPCRPEDVLCSTHCRVLAMSGDTTCQFCYCHSNADTILWEDMTTTVATTTSPAPSTTGNSWIIGPDQYIVNGIHYISLQNPCQETQGMCPMVCYHGNMTLNSRKCEYCLCPSNIDLTSSPANTNADTVMAIGRRADRKGRQCMPLFACPIFRCPEGQHFDMDSSTGCYICRCVPDDSTPGTTTNPTPVSTQAFQHSAGTRIPTTPEPYALALEMVCMTDLQLCPEYCHVINISVGDWTCHHCSCSQDQKFIALVRPCVQHSSVCPDNCTIRHLEDPSDPALTCQYCDCHSSQATAQAGQTIGRKKKLIINTVLDSCFNNQYCRQHFNPIDGAYCECHCPVGLTGQYCEHRVDNEMYGKVTTTEQTSASMQPFRLKSCLTNSSFCPSICLLTTVVVGHCYKCSCNGYYFSDHHIGLHIGEIPNTTTILPEIHSTPVTRPETTVTTTTPYITSTTQLTTTSPSTTTQPTTTTITTTTIATTLGTTTMGPVTTAAPVINTCFICTDVTCKQSDVKKCDQDKDYCMNNIIQDDQGKRIFSRECVDKTTCINKWWLDTVNRPNCLAMANGQHGYPNEADNCHFCCQGQNCNQEARIPNENLLVN